MAAVVVAERLTNDFQIGFWRSRPYRALDNLSLEIPFGAIDELQRQFDVYIRAHHQPANWADLNPGGPRNAVPVDPAGVPYEYDAAAGRAVLSPRSPLCPLPSTLGVK